jgi:hypothetical protein
MTKSAADITAQLLRAAERYVDHWPKMSPSARCLNLTHLLQQVREEGRRGVFSPAYDLGYREGVEAALKAFKQSTHSSDCEERIRALLPKGKPGEGN